MSEPMNFKGTRVMLIDASKIIRHCARTFLTSTGCEVFVSEDGFDALAKIADYHPDLIFLDVVMPRLDGFKACSLIKSNDKYKNVPIVMLSAGDSLFDRVRGRLAGADAYLTKPFSKESLLQVVAAHPRQFAPNFVPLLNLNFSPA